MMSSYFLFHPTRLYLHHGKLPHGFQQAVAPLCVCFVLQYQRFRDQIVQHGQHPFGWAGRTDRLCGVERPATGKHGHTG